MSGKKRSELFLACDLVGSTSYKQERGPGWQEAFLAFYRQFPQKVADVKGEHGVQVDFDLWKPIGDELIFTVSVRHEHDIYHAVRVWLEAMKRYEVTLAKDTSMSTKGGAFVATFPGPDSESSIPRDPDSETSDRHPVLLNDDALKGQRKHSRYLYDFFGPSIDTGFRVTSECTPRYFTISVEVAWALLLASRDESEMLLDDLTFLKPRELKGVWKGRDYPLFAIDRRHDDPVNQSIKKLVDGDLNREHAEKMCRECVTSSGWVSAIYLPDSGVEAVRMEPADSLADARAHAMELTGAETVLKDDHDPGKELPESAPLGMEHRSSGGGEPASS
ncbi:hypothetical protein [Nocardioides sp. R-C-SC26]|uniref:hypothetical protein n=1 Tax=Nocardioides sp. R-C-SC26 TaxID=2870414 RepID=UPI001E510952|nr:hypothetical protein [Nocardioides sp. R-C-SC26]